MMWTQGSLFFSRFREPWSASGTNTRPSAGLAAAPPGPPTLRPPLPLPPPPWPRLWRSLSTSATRSRGRNPPAKSRSWRWRVLRSSPWKSSSKRHLPERDANTASWSLSPHFPGERPTLHPKWFPSSPGATSHLWELFSEFFHREPEVSFTWYSCYGRQSRNGVSLCNPCELLWIPSFIQDWDTNVRVKQAKIQVKRNSSWPSSEAGCSLLTLSHLYLWKIKITVSIFFFFFLTLNFELGYFYLAMNLIFNFFLISTNPDVTQMFYHSQITTWPPQDKVAI